ncbi:hypothetical protein SAE02_69590 [Skermanella aerolata]|uniref:Uncharacterized protein n=1 Tax=Skermanella aerolata TaxID=393310 RepID=A0A512E254_9PROT|nr:hypothetical protein [Skermanella aerolata]GEO42811.1 hypothetical protein SAE02_69590 [Skermanella aerolata]
MLTFSAHQLLPSPTLPPSSHPSAVKPLFAELSFRRLGPMVEPVCTRVEYNTFSDQYLFGEIGYEVVEEEDEENGAVGLQYAAKASPGDD